MDRNDAKFGTVTVCVREKNDNQGHVCFEAWVQLYQVSEGYRNAAQQDDTKPKRSKAAQGEDAKLFGSPVKTSRSDSCCEFSNLPAARYYARATVGGIWADSDTFDIDADECRAKHVICQIDTGFRLSARIPGSDCTAIECPDGVQGKTILLVMQHRADLIRGVTHDEVIDTPAGSKVGDLQEEPMNRRTAESAVARDDLRRADTVTREQMVMLSAIGNHRATASMNFGNGSGLSASAPVNVRGEVQHVAGDISVTMRRTAPELTDDLALWVVIRNSNNALSFNNYATFMDQLFCGRTPPLDPPPFTVGQRGQRVSPFHTLAERRFLPYTDSDAYRLLKVATEAFVMVNCGVLKTDYGFSPEDAQYVLRKVGLAPELKDFWKRYLQSVNGFEDPVLPYLALVRRKLSEFSIKTRLFDDPQRLPPGKFEECWGILQSKLTAPCLMELIWSYWHEEGMLVQTLNAVTRRFQNVRVSVPGLDPLANFEVDPLRPLNNLLWAYTQDEQHRLSVVRRNYEYDHEYGLRLEGRAVSSPRPADTRSKFLEAFHHLLHLASQFYKQDDNTTIVADGFPVLNALKEVHLILSEGAHNQFGDLPSTARIEMLMQQWLLARPEFREFLPTRVMVAYPEAWMDRVDAMKRLQGWSDTNVLNFRNLGVFGEQLLLTIRYGNWSDVHDAAQGANWARFWRPEVQGYVHAYRAVSGVDLSQIAGDARVDATLPSTLLRRRLAEQQQRQRQ